MYNIVRVYADFHTEVVRTSFKSIAEAFLCILTELNDGLEYGIVHI